jgi:cysteine desulfurase
MTGLDGRRVYLDWNATAPLRPEARAAMLEAMDAVGNPSSVHAEGRAARAILERARGQVAALLGCAPQEIVFTSGATEAARVLEGAATPAGQRLDVFVEGTAHDCLRAHLSTGSWRERPHGPGHAFATGRANSETGVITPLPAHDEAGWIVDEGIRASRLLVDAVQALGRIPHDHAETGADFTIASAHKIGGPKGVGALVVRDGVEIAPLAEGGGQELGRRSGTENLPGIAGFGAAAEAARRELEAGAWERVERLRIILENTLAEAAPDLIVVGQEAERLPNTACFAVPGWKGETQVMQMDLAGFAVSAGAACSSGKMRESRVLRTMGHDAETARSAIRVSLGTATTEAEVMAFVRAWAGQYRKRRARAA